MTIKQQKAIKAFLVKKYGEEVGYRIFQEESSILSELIASIDKKTRNQRKTLIKTIFPRVALYKALLRDENTKDNAYETVYEYMIDIVGEAKHSSIAKMEKVPGFYKLYSTIFLYIMKRTDLQESSSKHGKDFFDITIKRCLWHSATVENGCPELCHAFCDVDDATYSKLKKIGFSRTETLGYGGGCCDFHFFKK